MDREHAGGARAMSLVVLGTTGMTTFRMPASGEVTIGRAPECQIRVDHCSLGERHATLRVGRPMILVELGSGSSTMVGTTRLAAGQQVPVSHGVILTLGAVQMSLQATGMSVAIEHVGQRRAPS